MPEDDDRFRVPGSRYEDEEPVAIAVIPHGALIDWSDDDHVPVSTLWLPESLFSALAECTLLQHVKVYQQTKLDGNQCALLCDQLIRVAEQSVDQDVRLAATLLLSGACVVATTSGGEVLLIEGP